MVGGKRRRFGVEEREREKEGATRKKMIVVSLNVLLLYAGDEMRSDEENAWKKTVGVCKSTDKTPRSLREGNGQRWNQKGRRDIFLYVRIDRWSSCCYYSLYPAG